MDGCSRQDPAYRPAKERASTSLSGPFLFPSALRPSVDGSPEPVLLRRHRGYPRFVAAATVARLADDAIRRGGRRARADVVPQARARGRLARSGTMWVCP